MNRMGLLEENGLVFAVCGSLFLAIGVVVCCLRRTDAARQARPPPASAPHTPLPR